MIVRFFFKNKSIIIKQEKFLATHHLSKTIEITRVNLFNIITQYRAIFNDEESTPGSLLRQEVNENMIFFTWVNDKVVDL